MSETDLSRTIAKAVMIAFPRAIVVRMQCGKKKVANGWMYFAPAGTPDRIVILPDGGSCWLEVKREDGELNDDQVRMHARLRALGHDVLVVRTQQEAIDGIRRAIARRREAA